MSETASDVPMCMTCRRRPSTVAQGKARYCEFCAPKDKAEEAECQEQSRQWLERRAARRQRPELHVWVPLFLHKKIKDRMAFPSELLVAYGGIWDRKSKAFLLPDLEAVEKVKAYLATHDIKLNPLPNKGWKAHRK